MAQKTLAIYGGSFDPVTIAHKQIITSLSQNYDYVIVTPAYQATLKSSHFYAFKDRVEMLEMLKLPANVSINRIEKTNYEKFGGKSYNLIKHFKTQYTDVDITFIIGADQLLNFDKWFNWKEIIKLCKIKVICRDGLMPEEYPWLIGNDLPEFSDFDTPIGCSSTKLRAAIVNALYYSKNKKLISTLAPEEIVDYLMNGKK